MARPDGIQFNRRMKRPVRVPTLHLHGSLDPVMRTRSAAGSGRVRRSAVPLAAVRRPRALPARGGPGGVLHRTGQLAEGPRAGPLTGIAPQVRGRSARHSHHAPHSLGNACSDEQPIARRIGQLGAAGAVIDLGAGADVGVWAGRTTTVTQHATAARPAGLGTHQRGAPQLPGTDPAGWAFRAFCGAEPAGSRRACATRAAEPRGAGLSSPAAHRARSRSASPRPRPDPGSERAALAVDLLVRRYAPW